MDERTKVLNITYYKYKYLKSSVFLAFSLVSILPILPIFCPRLLGQKPDKSPEVTAEIMSKAVFAANFVGTKASCGHKSAVLS